MEEYNLATRQMHHASRCLELQMAEELRKYADMLDGSAGPSDSDGFQGEPRILLCFTGGYSGIHASKLALPFDKSRFAHYEARFKALASRMFHLEYAKA
jgi:hypothetical protein